MSVNWIFVKGDVHGGGKGIQHRTGHCHASHQAQGDGRERPEEARG